MQKICIYLEHFCLLILVEWNAVFNTSSRLEALKKILIYWFQRRRGKTIGGETIPKPYSKKSKLSLSLSQ